MGRWHECRQRPWVPVSHFVPVLWHNLGDKVCASGSGSGRQTRCRINKHSTNKCGHSKFGRAARSEHIPCIPCVTAVSRYQIADASTHTHTHTHTHRTPSFTVSKFPLHKRSQSAAFLGRVHLHCLSLDRRLPVGCPAPGGLLLVLLLLVLVVSHAVLEVGVWVLE